MATNALRASRPFALIACAWIAQTAHAGVHTVDDSGGADFTQIQDAVVASADGDSILVLAGTYQPFTIDNKSLWIVAQANATVTVTDTVEVQNVAAGKNVFLSGLTVNAVSGPGHEPGLYLANNVGHVRAQKCTFNGASGAPAGLGASGANIASCFSVVFSQCTFKGGNGFVECDIDFCTDNYDSGGDGVSTALSAVAFYDCTLTGGNAATNKWQAYAGNGGHGCDVQSFGFFASGSRFIGGNGGIASDWAAPHGGDGGHGVRVVAGGAQLLDNQLFGGTGGIAPEGHPGSPGSPAQGNANVWTGDKRLCFADVLTPAGDTVSVTLIGQPGDRVYLPMTTDSNWRLAPARLGVWLVPLPVKLTYTPIAILPPSGTTVVQIPISNLPANEPMRKVFAQSLFRSTAGENVLGSPLHLLIGNCLVQTPDCNGNNAWDVCDVLHSTSIDCDANLVPDECQPDCNGNSIADSCDISGGFSDDTNGNEVPDECEPAISTWHVDDSAAPGGNGSAAGPFRTISEGVLASLTGHTVLVHDGVYAGPANRNLDFSGRDVLVQSVNGPANCTIDCQNAGTAFKFLNDADNQAARISGLKIINGNYGNSGGGAIDIRNSSPTIENCVFENCVGRAGAIYADPSKSTIRGCTFTNNGTLNFGPLAGAVHLRASSNLPGPAPALMDCVFIGNSSQITGGAVHVFGYEEPRISHCVFIGNSAWVYGGAISVTGSPGVVNIEHCLFVGNTVLQQHGGAIGGAGSNTIVRNCTVVGNSATTFGGGISFPYATENHVYNCVVWGNTAPQGAQMAVDGSVVDSLLVVRHSNVQGGEAAVYVGPSGVLSWSVSNIDAAPLFVDADGPDNNPATYGDNNYRLAATSPGIDAGNNPLAPTDWFDLDADSVTSELVPFDLDFLPRFFDDPAVTNTGVGPGPISDMGAYERRL